MHFSLQNLCELIVLPAQKTFVSWFWTATSMLWSVGGILFIVALILWVWVEFKTRFGTFHYNSENGFSPLFNSVVGGGVYFLLQVLLYFFFRVFFGGGVYCLPLPYAFHLLIFATTGKILNFVGFWPRLEKPNQKRWKQRY